MNNISRYITGGVVVFLSLWFIIFVGVIASSEIDVASTLFGAFFLVIGLFIIFNNKEDEIEEIKKD
jgi:tetrahydromethanopterin S-methyltransferase subunit E